MKLIVAAWLVLGFTRLSNGQGVPFRPVAGGIVTGIVKTAGNDPAASIRVAASEFSNSSIDSAAQQSLVSIAETDEIGRYRLENIPSGRYLIAAGRVDNPTYYPGTTDKSQAKPVTIAAGATISGIDFTMRDESVRVEDTYGPHAQTVSIPTEVRVEGGVPIPWFAYGTFPTIRWTRKDGVSVQKRLNDATADLPLLISGVSEYRVTVENLPLGFMVKSLTYGSIDLKADPVILASSAHSTFNAIYTASLAAARNGTAIPTTAANTPQAAPLSRLTLILAVDALSNATSGVRITGRTTSTGTRSVYISGIPGIYYSDGTFEFRGVPSGRQTILLFDPEQPVGGGVRGVWTLLAGRTVVVGDKDIQGVALESIKILPTDISPLMAPGPASTRPLGPIPMAAIRGRVVSDSGEPISGGTATISGRTRSNFSIDADGHFAIPSLLPGTYNLEIGGFGHQTVRRTIEVEVDDIELNLISEKL